MLEKVRIENYRCYADHEINFKQLTIAVGKNNAGKSTLIEALRLISFAATRFRTTKIYKDPPVWTELPKRVKGISPSLKSFGFQSDNLFHRYGNPPSKIIASFDNKLRITIYIGDEMEAFCIMQDEAENYITSSKAVDNCKIDEVNILPQISPLQKEEKILSREDYIRQNLSTDLSSLHFRNQLRIFSENFKRFKELAEGSWQGLRIRELNGKTGVHGDNLSLLVQDSAFVAEIGWMGHGLQMWLQIIWFLSRVDTDSVIILDEPDVYMHPELQRKLIRLLKSRFKQIIIATHSIEIISEVEAENILIIDKESEESTYASNVPVVQRILNSIGSIHNLQLTKLWSSGKLLIVEGEDINILKRLQNIIFPHSNEPLDSIPNFDIGGWGGWNYAKGSRLLLRDTVDTKIKMYCLFDSDYHTEKQLDDRKEDAKKLGVEIHIWKRKEIENYLIVPAAILRIVKKEANEIITINEDDIKETIVEIVSEYSERIIHNLATEIQSEDRKLSITTAIYQAKKLAIPFLERISGKELISQLSKWTQSKFHVTLNPIKLAQALEKREVEKEVIQVLEAIENSTKFAT